MIRRISIPISIPISISIPSILKNISSFLYSSEPYRQLGRWCHPGIPNCTQDVLLKKIDFANSDNNFCNKKPQIVVTRKVPLRKLEIRDNIEPNTFTPQEYIDAMQN